MRAAPSTIQNTPRQPATWMTKLPVSGASSGEMLNTSISSDMSRVASTPECRSRTTARGITMPPQAPSPCTKRPSRNSSALGARAQATLPQQNSVSPTYSGGLRPYMSDSGPYSSWPPPTAMKNTVRLSCTVAAFACRLWPIEGSAGRYMSMANGPIAESSPRMMPCRK